LTTPAGGPDHHLLVLNCGSATVKTKLYRETDGRLAQVSAGLRTVESGHRRAIDALLAELPRRPDAIAHRVVHGGDHFPDVALLNDEALRLLREVVPLAPLHNGPALEGIAATATLGVPLVAAFDSAFHHTLPEVARRYALPVLPGVRRYGFHGWSHRWVTERYSALSGSREPTIISLHLGGGSSAAAIRQGKSVDTSMGYSPLEGLVMGTRPGDLDPGVIAHLLLDGMPPGRLETLLNHESGLLGVAGSADMRELLRRTDPSARLAVDLFCYRVRKYIGAYLSVLSGAEAIVFTGGIGERSPDIRGRICEGFAWAGLALDPERNRTGEGRISSDGSHLAAYVIATDEERPIAREAARLLGWAAGQGA
jgi:acetate kinase